VKNNISSFIDKIATYRFSKLSKQIVEDFKEELNELNFEAKNSSLKITVVGEFSAGKSTFLNALIGKDILTHSRNETTAVITSIYNSTKEDKYFNKMVVLLNDKTEKVFNLDSDFNMIKEFTTTISSKYNVVKDVAEVKIYIDIPGVTGNVVFIDTPGFNGIADHHREITIDEIKSAHTSIVIFGNKGLTNSGREFLKLINKYQDNIVYVLNAVDLFNEFEGEYYEKEVDIFKNHLLDELKLIGYPKQDVTLFGVSSLKALIGRDKTQKKLYDKYEIDLTEKDRILHYENSYFQTLVDYLWKVVANQKEKIINDTLKIKLKSILDDIKGNLNKKIEIINAKIDDNQLALIEKEKICFEERYNKSKEFNKNFICAAGEDLLDEMKKIIKRDYEELLNYIDRELCKEEFETINRNIDGGKYNKFIENQNSELFFKYKLLLESNLEDIYNSLIMKINNKFKTTVYINNSHKIVSFDITNFEDNFDIKSEIKQLKDRQEKIRKDEEQLQKEKMNLLNEKWKIDSEVKYKMQDFERQLSRRESEINELGAMPGIDEIRKSRKKDGAWNKIKGVFGKEEYESYYVTDSSKRDRWNRDKEEITKKYSRLAVLEEEKDRFILEQTKLNNSISLLDSKLKEKRVEIDVIIKKLENKEFEMRKLFEKNKREYLRNVIDDVKVKLEDFINNILVKNIVVTLEKEISKNVNSIILEADKYLNRKYKLTINELDTIFRKRQGTEMVSEQDIALLKEDIKFLDTITT
jgi:hypothetical protein